MSAWRDLEAMAVAAEFGDDEHRQTAMADRPIGVGPRQQHEHVAAGTERAPGLHAVDDIAVDAVERRRRRGDLDAGDVGAVVGLGHRHRVHDLGRGQAGQPLLLLLLGAAGLEGAGEDLGTGDERTAGTEGAA